MTTIAPLKILKASAGSGKTFSLAAHYLTLLFAHEYKYREILAVTFTNKATEEMKTRILEVLKGLAQGDTSKQIEDYRRIIVATYPDLSASAAMQLKAERIYRRILHDYSRFSVSTIDGFVQKVLRSFAFELGLDSSYSLELNREKIKKALVEKLEKELDKKPELVEWLIRLAKDRIDADKSWNYKRELLELTEEIFKERFTVFEAALNSIDPKELDNTFTQLADKGKQIVRETEKQYMAFAQQAQDYLDRQQIQVDDLAGKSRAKLLKLKKIIAGDFKAISGLFDFAENPSAYFQKTVHPDKIAELGQVLATFEAYHLQNNGRYILALQFNANVYYLRLIQEIALLLKAYRDETASLLISDVQQLLTGITDDAGDNPSFIWEKIGNTYRHFLFDEFQDTSTSQWNSFRSLVQNSIAEPSEDKIDNLIVGDTKQSIYRWRNGDWRILEAGVSRDVGDHNIVHDTLQDNYRSTRNIIALNNKLYAIFPQLLQDDINAQVDKTGNEQLSNWWTSGGYNHTLLDLYRDSTQNPTPHTLEGGVVKAVQHEKEGNRKSSFEELALADIVQEIRHLKDNKGYAYKDMGVLVRNNMDATKVVQYLMRQDIPVLSGEALLIESNSAVQLLINTLKILVGYTENNSLAKAACALAYAQIQGKTLDTDLLLNIKYKPLAELTHVLPKDLCLQGKEWTQLPLVQLIEHIIRSYQLDKIKSHLPYLLAFRDIASHATKQGERGIISFLHWWAEEGRRKTLPSPEDTDAVQIMTIHKSKGLAFRAVFIPFCNISLGGKPNSTFWVPSENTDYAVLQSIPLKLSKALGESAVANHYFEELLHNYIDTLNLLYVATTRAKDYLYIGLEPKQSSTLTTTADLFQAACNTGQLTEEDLYQEEYIVKASKTSDKHFFSLDTYPTSERLSEIFNAEEEDNAHHFLQIEDAGRQGSILHELLAQTSNEEELDKYLYRLNTQGTIHATEIENLKKSTQAVWENPQLAPILQKALSVVVEKSITDPTGKVHRPDKVLFTADEVIVLDYKFTLSPSRSHQDQVETYKRLLGQMFDQPIKGYLYYAVTGQLIHV